jgi:hypothetical protein
MRAALLLPDGVGVRNFLVGPFQRAARARGVSLSVLAAVAEHLQAAYQAPDGLPLDWHPYRVYRDTPALFVVRNMLTYAHMYSVDTWSMRCVRELPIQGRGRRRAAAGAARVLGRLLARVGGVDRLERRLGAAVARLPETAWYRDLFARIRPDVVVSSNQRPYGILPAVLAARSLGIPAATCIFSWDNLTCKGRIAAPFDHYFVWSALMQRELLRYYPHVPPERIHIVGALQFDPYADRALIHPRERFFAAIGADPNRPLICYSSGEPSIAPEDQHHVALLLTLIREGRIAGRPQVVLRPTPTADARRFDDVRRRFPELISAQPEWVSAGASDWSQALPRPADVAFLTNLAHHSDLNINVASTMTLDFAVHDRPVVNVAFDVADPPPFGRPLWDYYYRFEHYQPVIETGAALVSRSVGELVEHVNLCLARPRLHAENRRRLVELELGVPVGEASGRLLDAMLRVANAAQERGGARAPVVRAAAAPGVERGELAMAGGRR